jgi:hypothetical protein
MDDWRVNRGLTINFGVRYEYFAPYTELYGHLANLDINPAFTAVDVVTAGGSGNDGIGGVGAYFGQYPASLVKGDPHAFSPRFGLAWRPSQKYNRVIRLGYSIFYSGSTYSGFATQMAAQPPFANNINDTGTLLAPLPLQNAFIKRSRTMCSWNWSMSASKVRGCRSLFCRTNPPFRPTTTRPCAFPQPVPSATRPISPIPSCTRRKSD